MMKITKRPFEHLAGTVGGVDDVGGSVDDCISSGMVSCSLESPSVPKKRKMETPLEQMCTPTAGPRPGLAKGVNEQKFIEWVPRNKKARYQASQPTDKIFNTTDVKMMLAKAIEETKARLQKEYEETLQLRLAEHWQQFATYNTDHNNRALRSDVQFLN
eukprot:TRINITY_DN2168_c0_g1_i1.p1 TRINITY_DN2168_c0_g1~~TRINITY_DN2168_c0_g1_i1.p1  ORF type:complete len:159 (-),score=24.41 TRINITY_DN2168_c0_g1_i1:126-602(-)